MELLVVVVIIGILAGVILGALQAARESAREAKTKAVIAKINNFVMAKHESYRGRRAVLNSTTLPASPTHIVLAQARLNAIRDLMRMEMPDRWSDVTGAPLAFAGGPITRPALSTAYLARFTASPPDVAADQYASAECLYMIVTMSNSEARGQFADNEVGDVNGNGYPEFIDGWGNPIKFLRWAPGFPDSDVQSKTVTIGGSPETASADATAATAAATNDHDPFDPRKVSPGAWRLVPLVYSAGRDGIYDINIVNSYTYGGDPYSQPLMGAPIDSDNTSVTATRPADGYLGHYDNIHNHRIEAR